MNNSMLPLILNLIVKMSLSVLPLLMKLDDDNLAVKSTSSCSAAEQPPLLVKVQNNASMVLTIASIPIFSRVFRFKRSRESSIVLPLRRSG
jgi:hypothetical protein